jgi:hypothetical protein
MIQIKTDKDSGKTREDVLKMLKDLGIESAMKKKPAASPGG